jgi:hypothetical protein
MSWVMARDVQQARLHMNLSQWREYSAEDRIKLLSEIGSAVKNHEMPVQRYVLLHSEARLSDQERDQVYQWTRTERKRLKFRPSPSGPERQENRPLGWSQSEGSINQSMTSDWGFHLRLDSVSWKPDSCSR